METRDFFYLSKTKIDSYYGQNRANRRQQIETQIGGTAFGVSGNIAIKESQDKNYYEKLQYIEKRLQQEEKTGSLITPGKEFLKDDLKLECSIDVGLTIWRSWYYDTINHVYYRLLMYGSTSNVISSYQSQYPCFSGSSLFEVMATLETAIQNKLDKLDESGEVNKYLNSFIDDISHDEFNKRYFKALHLDITENWQIVEAMFTTRDQRYIVGDDRIQRVLARVDYRQTITRDHYEEHFLKQFDVDEHDRHFSHARRYARPELFIPEDAEYIVYIYASPMAVEFLNYNMNIHIIDGKTYLFIDNETMKKYEKKYSSQCDLIEYLAALLGENMLFEQGWHLKNEYYNAYRHNNWRFIPEEDFSKIIKKYITDIPNL